MSNQWLSSVNTFLQWVAVVGVLCALGSSVGLIFTRKEMSARQAILLQTANADAATAREEVARVKKYAYVATLTINGMVYTKGDVIMPTGISQAVEGTWHEISPDDWRPVCEPAALDRSRAAIVKFPDFPFTYYALAYCLIRSNDGSWRPFAEKAVEIFKNTTSINGHQSSHDSALAYLQQELARTRP